MVEVLGKPGRLGYHVGPSVIAKHEAHTICVIAIELGREGEVGVPPEQDLLEPGLATECYSFVIERDHALMRWPVSTQRGQVQRLPPQADAGGPITSISRTAPHLKVSYIAPPSAFVTHSPRNPGLFRVQPGPNLEHSCLTEKFQLEALRID